MNTKTLSTMKFATLLLLLLLQFISAGFANAGIQASIDREYAYEGETVTLSISADSRANQQDPDFSPLQKDFEIGGTSESTQISIYNGRRSDKHTWSVRLMPLRSGVLEIPSIQVGNESTLPIKVDIRPIPVQSGSQQGEPLFMTMEIDSKADKFYVQQQIPVVLRLYYKHQLNQGQITDPTPADAMLEKLGEDRSYQSTYNSQQYTVYERRYSLFAEKSGQLQLPSASFRGYMKAPGKKNQPQRHDFFSQFTAPSLMSQGQPVSIRSKALSLQIEPHPTTFSGQYWLPAESVEIKDSWTDNPPTLRVGEPLSRVITLTAKGLVASQLKPLDLPDISSFRRYAEPAETTTTTDGQQVYATSRQTFTYIPSYAGEQDIPSLQLPWWNVLTSQQETARLPAWKVIVEANPNQPLQTAPPTTAGSNVTSAPALPAPAEVAGKLTTVNDELTTNNILARLRTIDKDTLLITAIASLSLLLLVTFVLLLRKSSRKPPAIKAQEAPPTAHNAATLRELRASLQQACSLNDAKAACQLLMQLARELWPHDPPASLGSIADRLPDAGTAIRELDRHLYAGSDAEWDASALLKQLDKLVKAVPEDVKKQETLKPLYPA